MLSLQVRDIPDIPDTLNKEAGKYFTTYCKAMLDRGDLQQQYLGDIETLAWYESQRNSVIRKINEKGDLGWLRDAGDDVRGNGLFAQLQKLEKEIQKYKKRLLLSPKLRPDDVGGGLNGFGKKF